MEVIVALFATIVAASCLVAVVKSDKKPSDEPEESSEAQDA